MSGVYWNKKRGFWKSFRVFPIVLIAWRSLLTRLLAFWLKSWRRNYLVAATVILWMMLCEIRSANILRRHMNITWREQGLVYKSTYFQIFEVSFTCLQVIWLKDQITLDWKREANRAGLKINPDKPWFSVWLVVIPICTTPMLYSPWL